MDTPLDRAISAMGTAAKLAEALGISGAAISQWKAIPLGRVAAISAATGIPKHELRPDFFDAPGPAPSDAPSEAAA